MKKLSSLILLCMAICAVACQSSDDPKAIEQNTLHESLMAVHDEVMPKMGEMNKLRKKLVRISESTTLAESDLATVKEAIVFLKNADEGMMDWMAEYQQPSKLRKQKKHEEIMAYLSAEKNKIEQVKQDMLASIATAKELVEKHGGGE